jgi:Cdc6-like AAA superfamily ATPase
MSCKTEDQTFRKLSTALAAAERHYMRLHDEGEDEAELQREITLGQIISAASKLPPHALSALWAAALNLEREHS